MIIFVTKKLLSFKNIMRPFQETNCGLWKVDCFCHEVTSVLLLWLVPEQWISTDVMIFSFKESEVFQREENPDSMGQLPLCRCSSHVRISRCYQKGTIDFWENQFKIHFLWMTCHYLFLKALYFRYFWWYIFPSKRLTWANTENCLQRIQR